MPEASRRMALGGSALSGELEYRSVHDRRTGGFVGFGGRTAESVTRIRRRARQRQARMSERGPREDEERTGCVGTALGDSMTIRHLVGGVSALALAASALLGAGTAANATEGYFQTGYGTIQKAQSGAGIANPEDAMSLSVNPAGLVYVGRQFEAAFTLFSPNREYTATNLGGFPTAMGTVKSTQDLFLMPNMAYSSPIDAQSAWGVAIFGNGGMNTNYQANVFGAGQTGVNLEQMFLTAGYARKMGDFSIGVAPVIAIQKFKATGFGFFDNPFFTAHPGSLTNNGDDYAWGAGFRAGLQWNLTKQFRVGLSGQTPIWSSKFSKYAGLFADGGSFDIPANVTVGIAYDVTPELTLMADYRHIFYGGVPAIANTGATLGAVPLGAHGGPGFGWKDVDVISIAAAWKATKDLTLRAGYSHNNNPIGSDQVFFNTVAPGVVTDHISAGASYAVSKNLDIDLAAAYVPKVTTTGADPFGNPGSTIALSMSQWEASFGVRYKY